MAHIFSSNWFHRYCVSLISIIIKLTSVAECISMHTMIYCVYWFTIFLWMKCYGTLAISLSLSLSSLYRIIYFLPGQVFALFYFSYWNWCSLENAKRLLPMLWFSHDIPAMLPQKNALNLIKNQKWYFTRENNHWWFTLYYGLFFIWTF